MNTGTGTARRIGAITVLLAGMMSWLNAADVAPIPLRSISILCVHVADRDPMLKQDLQGFVAIFSPEVMTFTAEQLDPDGRVKRATDKQLKSYLAQQFLLLAGNAYKEYHAGNRDAATECGIFYGLARQLDFGNTAMRDRVAEIEQEGIRCNARDLLPRLAARMQAANQQAGRGANDPPTEAQTDGDANQGNFEQVRYSSRNVSLIETDLREGPFLNHPFSMIVSSKSADFRIVIGANTFDIWELANSWKQSDIRVYSRSPGKMTIDLGINATGVSTKTSFDIDDEIISVRIAPRLSDYHYRYRTRLEEVRFNARKLVK